MRITAPLGTNGLLAILPESARAHLLTLLAPVRLALRQTLETPGAPIAHLYFVETGMVSVVAIGNDNRRTEIGLIGHEGITGLAAVLGADSSPNQSTVQGAGSALRISATAMHQAMATIPALNSLLLRFAHVFMVQAAHTSLSNGNGTLPQRLARWILMAQDRLESESIALTHELLATMLAVRRPGVTVALHVLEGRGLIRSSRGLITLLDRSGLIALAAGSYGIPEAEYGRVVELR